MKLPIFLKKAILLILISFFFIPFFSACNNNSSTPSATEENSGNRENKPLILSSTATEKDVLENSNAKIDISNTSKGFINVKYLGGEDKVKVQVTGASNTTYTYDLSNKGNYETFPLTQGDGNYVVSIYKNITGTQYAQVLSESFNVSLESETSPYLYPNQYVSFSNSSDFVSLSKKLGKDCTSELDVVTNVYEYVIKNIKYDDELAENPPSGYIPDIDNIIKTKKGICFDYASLMTALLRSQRIPTKLVIGYSGSAYHAWISVYIEEVGWVEDIIYFDGKDWVRMDPTFGANYSGSSDELQEYVGDGKNYKDMFYY